MIIKNGNKRAPPSLVLDLVESRSRATKEKRSDGEWRQETYIQYGKTNEMEFWTMDMFDWAKRGGSLEDNDVVLVLSK